MTYLITFGRYGAWLHGDPRGSTHHRLGSLDPNPWLEGHERNRMVEPQYQLDESARTQVSQAIQEVCRYRAWQLIALHVRQQHVHAVVELEGEGEHALRDFKAYSTRRLKQQGLDPDREKRWAKSGNITRLQTREAIQNAVRYVIEDQGAPMATYLAEGF